MQRLDVSNCRSFIPRGILAIAKLTQLTALDLNHCYIRCDTAAPSSAVKELQCREALSELFHQLSSKTQLHKPLLFYSYLGATWDLPASLMQSWCSTGLWSKNLIVSMKFCSWKKKCMYDLDCLADLQVLKALICCANHASAACKIKMMQDLTRVEMTYRRFLTKTKNEFHSHYVSAWHMK